MKELLAALSNMKAELGKVEMTGRNDHDRYDYLTESDIIYATDPLLEKHGLFLVKSVVDAVALPDRVTSQGKPRYAHRVKLGGTLYHVASGESMEASAYGEGQDGGDKGIYKATTGASKYLMAKFFGVATGDDPEADSRSKGLTHEEQAREWMDGYGLTSKHVVDYCVEKNKRYDQTSNFDEAIWTWLSVSSNMQVVRDWCNAQIPF